MVTFIHYVVCFETGQLLVLNLFKASSPQSSSLYFLFQVPVLYTITVCRLLLKCDGTRAETRFRLSAKRTNPFKSSGVVSSVDCCHPRCALRL